MQLGRSLLASTSMIFYPRAPSAFNNWMERLPEVAPLLARLRASPPDVNYLYVRVWGRTVNGCIEPQLRTRWVKTS